MRIVVRKGVSAAMDEVVSAQRDMLTLLIDDIDSTDSVNVEMSQTIRRLERAASSLRNMLREINRPGARGGKNDG